MSLPVNNQTFSTSSPSLIGFFDTPAASALATPVMVADTAMLKARLTAIVNDVQMPNPKEAQKSLSDLRLFLDAVAEQSGTHIQNIFGQHVTNNILFVVMDSVVRPALTQYCSAAGRRRSMATRAAGRGANATSRRQHELTALAAASPASLVAEEELDALRNSKAKKLCTDVVRPWRALVETLHHNLPSSLLLAQASSSLGTSSNADNEEAHMAAVGAAASGTRGGQGGHAEEESAASKSFDGQWMTSRAAANRTEMSSVAGLLSTRHLWARTANHTSLPLLWKNAVPLFSITRHALEVLRSEVLVAVCGQEYAKLLLHLFLFNGYLSNLQPGIIMELIMRLLELIERTVYEVNSTDTTVATSTNRKSSPLLAEMSPHSDVGNQTRHGVEGHVEDDVYHPHVEQGTTFAALLVQLFRAPQLMSAFTPFEDEATLLLSTSTANNGTVPFIMQRLVRLTTQRHMRPTSALRLETHLLIALKLLVTVARDDCPLTSAMPLELVKPLCHFFYTTTRRDGWRMEALTFMTTQLCVCFSAVLGRSVRADIERHRPHGVRCSQEAAPNEKNNEKGLGGNMSEGMTSACDSVLVSPYSLTLLHETVLPFMLQLFKVVRSEFGHVSRRELFHFPCPPLAPLFEFGAVVFYLACSTHEAYIKLPSLSSFVTPAASPAPAASASVTTIPTVSDDALSKRVFSQEKQREQKGIKRSREEEDVMGEKTGEHSRRKKREIPPQPGEALLQLFRSLFFLDSVSDDATAGTTGKTRGTGGKDDVGNLTEKETDTERDTDCLLRVSAAAGGSLSAAAVQDLVKDGSLFMLHLLAHPGTTLGCSESQCTLLVEHGVLPLFPYYGVRLETLLLAVLLAVTPRASLMCQQDVFRWLVRRYMPTVTTQRDDESQPKEHVYRLLSVLLGRGVVGRWPLWINGEERARLQAAAHFSAISTRIRAVLYGVSKSLPKTVANVPQHTAALPPAMMASLIATATAGHRSKTGLSTPLFMAMLQFLSLYQHYGAISAEIIAAQRMTRKKHLPEDDLDANHVTTALKDHSLPHLPSAAVCFSTGVAFVISGLSHAVCFLPHDESVVWRHDTDTAAAASTCYSSFMQALCWAEEYLLAACFTVTENELGWQHLPIAVGGAMSDPAKNKETSRGHGGGGGKTAASLQRMKQLLARSRQVMDAMFIAPEKHVPIAVCDAVEGHWLLLHEFFAASTEEPLAGIDAVRTEKKGIGNFTNEDEETDVSELFLGRLRRGDVPLGFVEILSGEVMRAVGELAERAKVIGAASVGLAGGSSLQQPPSPPSQQPQHQQKQREVDEDAVAMAHRTLCINAVQLMHLLLRLFRLGIWQLPQGHRSCPKGCEGSSSDNTNNNNNTDDSNKIGKNSSEDDLCILSDIPHMQLFDHPLSILRRLSPEGRLYYAVMWICRHLATRLLRGSAVRDRVLMRSLLILFHDVGTVLLSQSFALWEPRQVVLSFVGVVSRRALDEGLAKLASWQPTNVTSADAVAAVHATMRLSCSLLSAILTLVRRTHVLAASADPLVSPARVTAVILHILEKDGLIPATMEAPKGHRSEHLMNYGSETEMPSTQNVSNLNPFLPFSLAVVDGVLGLLQVLHEAYGDTQARLAARQLLETLFARYRYSLAESIFLTFSNYAPPHRGVVSSTVADGMNYDEENEEEETMSTNTCNREDVEEVSHRVGQNLQTPGGTMWRGKEKKRGRNAHDDFLFEEGQLLEVFVDQLTDVSRNDMPVLTPQLQCAVLSSIYGVLFRCESSVAEKLGKYLFSFLSIKTAYVVRKHTALQVRWLFNRFTHRTYAVLQELLYRAREGIASISPMHSATSLRALGEAAHAAPMLEADIICTLLECWATQGFAHKGLLLECLEFIGKKTRLRESGFATATAMTGTAESEIWMSAQGLCHYHCERLLFDWLWRLGHPMEAFPVVCFGYAGLQQMWQALMPTLLPLALLCSARQNGAEGTSVFLHPSVLLWRLAACHKRSGDAASNNSRTRELLVGCVRAYFPDVMARLLVFAALSKRHGRSGGVGDVQEIAEAAHIALEWMGSTFSTEYVPFVRHYADAILCRLVELVGTMTPFVRVRPLQEAVTMLCDIIANAPGLPSTTGPGVGNTALDDFHLDDELSSLATMTTVDRFFASDGGDHAYVLLQQLYAGLTHDVHRGTRHTMLALLFEQIVRHWWGRELLQRVPHILHTVLRLCGNILLTCVDVRARACNVLLYVWTQAVSNKAHLLSSSLPTRIVSADEAFISTVMLTLAEDSRVVASTWNAICRADATLEQQDWKLQHARYTAESFVQNEDVDEHEVIVITPGANEEAEEHHRHVEKKGEESACLHLEKNDGQTLSVTEAIRQVTRILPLLKSTVHISGAPASSFYTDAAAAVDRARPAFVKLIQVHIREGEAQSRLQGRVGLMKKDEDVARRIQMVYEMCCGAVQHLLTLVCMGDAFDLSSQTMMATPLTRMRTTTAPTTTTSTAFKLLRETTREVQLSVFRLLRALCWCFIEAGAEGHVDALLYPVGAMQRMLQEWPFDKVLHCVYRQHVEQLYRLAFDADADVARVASTTLRGWLCGITTDNNGVEAIGEGVDGASENVIMSRRTCAVASITHRRRGAGDEGDLIRRTLEEFSGDETRQEGDVQKASPPPPEDKEEKEGDVKGSHASSVILLKDILPFRRHLFDAQPQKHATVLVETSLKVASLLDEVVWDALRVHEDESQFLRLFLVALIRHYKLHHRFSTVATVLHHVLLRPFSSRSGGLILFIESYLPIVLLHTMLVRESETQRSQRAVWSRALETHLFRRACGFLHMTRLFLRALNVCHSVLMTVVRSHGVRSENLESNPLSRMSPSEWEAAAASLTFPLFVRSEYGELPELSDVRDSYWLSDIDPLVLASAAVTCHEPHLAALFTELSGESLLGRRKGIPSAAMTIVGQPKCSVLFPFKRRPSSREDASREGHRRMLRGDETEAEMTQRLATYRAAVYAVLVDVETTLRFRDGSDNGGMVISGSRSSSIDGTSAGGGGRNGSAAVGNNSSVMQTAGDGGDLNFYMSPWEEAFFLQHPARLMEREKSRGNWHAVLLLIDRIEGAMRPMHVSSGIHRPYFACGFSSSRLLVEKANALMQLGAADTAVQMLAAALKRHAPPLLFAAAGDRRRGKHEVKEETGAEEEEEDYFLQLRSALAATLWRLGRWDLDFLEETEGTHRHHKQRRDLLLPSLVSVEEGIFYAMRAAHHGEHHNVRRWTTQALQRLACQFDETNWFQSMLQAEALHDIEECGRLFLRSHSSLSSSTSSTVEAKRAGGMRRPPPWVRASLVHVHAPYRELELLDSVHHRLCVLYRQPQWWLSHLENSSERALRSNRPVLVHQWLSAYSEFTGGDVESQCGVKKEEKEPFQQDGTIFEKLITSHQLPAIAFLALVQARAEFVGGRPHRAIAILQNTEMSSSEEPTSVMNGLLFPMPANAPQMPAIVQQLVVWAREARLVPLSQLVRDPFLLLSVKNDRTGVCCLQLARLCHTLVRDITARLHSEEYRKLQESIGASHRIRVELEQQQQMSDGLSDAEKRILQRRIRTLAVETTREEDEWQREVEMYALYRRSALNAYARFLERSGPAESDSLLAVFAFVSLWLQQDERLDERRLKAAGSAASVTSGIIQKAIKNVPLHKFLPLFSQLVAQLGTSLDDTNLESLVLHIAMENPLHAVWPLLALANGENFGPAVATVAHGGGSSGLHVVDEKKVTLARQILRTLKSPTNRHDEDEDGAEDDRSTMKEEENKNKGRRCGWREKIVTEAERLSAAYIQLAFYRVYNKNRPDHRIPADCMITEKGVRDLLIPPPTFTLPLYSLASQSALPALLQQLPKIVRYENTFTTPGGINLPKALRCVLSDGRIVRQLLKSEDDMRQDSLIEQVFCLSNQLLAQDKRTCRLHVFTYNVVPLAPTVGIIEWVDGTIPLGQYLNGDPNGGGTNTNRLRFQTGAHERYFPGEPTSLECRARLQEANKSQKHGVLLDLYAEFSPALHYFFLEHFFTPQEWLERREAYTRSVAASSIIGYIVGLGDRHGNNLLLHTQRAELVHIDLGFAFDQGKQLPVPELVPFRLTRNIVDGFGVQGTEGSFRRHCEGTLGVLRGQRELLMTILEACAHDPLARWAVTVLPPQRQQGRPKEIALQLDEEEEGEAVRRTTPRQRDLGVSRGKPTYADAERVLSHVAEKIEGYESGELLSVPTHVHKLLQTAQNTELLAQMFVGWSPWL
ncbi:phosphatidylinositol kinase related protein [Trypanosoma cruzi Dm28c]|uniref:non-specific serine/threonine protein kinase n=1 Tax=Trypanosoma cruzi Dm28c TaxID=1416333 RepID=V5D6N7_TRYCR|nr:phosphatidylinositol kinase related protein [Trypanosoma cruzi Dm28c]